MDNKILILGVGNEFRRDDGVGPKVINLLKKLSATKLKNIDLLNGGIDGLALLDVIKLYDKVLIIDAINMNELPGTMKSFSLDQAKIRIKSDALSTHGFGIAELIALIQSLNFKTQIQIIGIQPKNIAFGENLTELITSKLEAIVNLVVKIVFKLH